MKKINIPIFQKLLLGVTLTVISATAAKAQTLIIANTDNTTIFPSAPTTYTSDGDLGFTFQVGANNLLLTNLGVAAPSGTLAAPALVSVYQVDVYSNEVALVARATVAAGTTANSEGFAYDALPTPATLLAGDEYAIDYEDSSVDSYYNSAYSESSSASDLSQLFDTDDITPGGVTLNGDPNSADPAFPTQVRGYPYYVGPNAEFVVGELPVTTPEPSSAALLVAGTLAALLVAVRSRYFRNS